MENRAQILARYEPLARKVAGRFRQSGLPMDDLRQAARLGILVGIDKFDVGRTDGDPRALTATLALWARHEVQRACGMGSRPVSTTSGAFRRLAVDVKREMALAEAKGLDGAQARQAASDALSVPIGRVEMVVAVMTPSGPPQEDECGVVDDAPDLDADRRREILVSVMAGLDERERRAVMGHDIEGLSWPVLGREMGISGERVRQIATQARRKMRADIEARGLSLSDLL